jgi:hypothetical protein
VRLSSPNAPRPPKPREIRVRPPRDEPAVAPRPNAMGFRGITVPRRSGTCSRTRLSETVYLMAEVPHASGRAAAEAQNTPRFSATKCNMRATVFLLHFRYVVNINNP